MVSQFSADGRALPTGWLSGIDTLSGYEYFYDTVNATSQWEFPDVEPVPGQLFTDGQVGYTQPASQFSEAEQQLSQESPAEVSQAAADAGISQEEWTSLLNRVVAMGSKLHSSLTWNSVAEEAEAAWQQLADSGDPLGEDVKSIMCSLF